MKKIVVFGGGTGLSCLLEGLTKFPVDVTTVIAVSDNGSSTGVLRKELDIPAVGDIGKVLISMANVDDEFLDLLRYRFAKDGSLHNHPVRNIMLAALIDMKGSLTEATRYMCKILKIKGTVLPLTEDSVDLVGENSAHEQAFFGEEAVSANVRNIARLSYDRDVHVSLEVVSKIMEADLIIFSPGSLYTSILPHLLAEGIVDAMMESKAPSMYVSNLVTQPGETENYTASDHIRAVFAHGGKLFDYCLVNDAPAEPTALERYGRKGAEPVAVDAPEIEKLGVIPVLANVAGYDNSYYRHNPWLLAAELIRLYGEKSQTRVYKTGRK